MFYRDATEIVEQHFQEVKEKFLNRINEDSFNIEVNIKDILPKKYVSKLSVYQKIYFRSRPQWFVIRSSFKGNKICLDFIFKEFILDYIKLYQSSDLNYGEYTASPEELLKALFSSWNSLCLGVITFKKGRTDNGKIKIVDEVIEKFKKLCMDLVLKINEVISFERPCFIYAIQMNFNQIKSLEFIAEVYFDNTFNIKINNFFDIDLNQFDFSSLNDIECNQKSQKDIENFSFSFQQKCFDLFEQQAYDIYLEEYYKTYK